MHRGWIKLYRGLTTNWLWDDGTPFDRRSAWIDLLLLANHSDHEIIRNGEKVTVKRGDVNRSILQLAERWKWSRGKVLRFLKILESEKMIHRYSTTDGTTLTIVNYTKYQIEQTTNGTTKRTTGGTTDGTTDGHIQECNKNDIESKRMFNYLFRADDTELTDKAKAKYAEIRKKARAITEVRR